MSSAIRDAAVKLLEHLDQVPLYYPGAVNGELVDALRSALSAPAEKPWGFAWRSPNEHAIADWVVETVESNGGIKEAEEEAHRVASKYEDPERPGLAPKVIALYEGAAPGTSAGGAEARGDGGT